MSVKKGLRRLRGIGVGEGSILSLGLVGFRLVLSLWLVVFLYVLGYI